MTELGQRSGNRRSGPGAGAAWGGSGLVLLSQMILTEGSGSQAGAGSLAWTAAGVWLLLFAPRSRLWRAPLFRARGVERGRRGSQLGVTMATDFYWPCFVNSEGGF